MKTSLFYHPCGFPPEWPHFERLFQRIRRSRNIFNGHSCGSAGAVSQIHRSGQIRTLTITLLFQMGDIFLKNHYTFQSSWVGVISGTTEHDKNILYCSSLSKMVQITVQVDTLSLALWLIWAIDMFDIRVIQNKRVNTDRHMRKHHLLRGAWIEKASAPCSFGVPLWHWVWWKRKSGSCLWSWPVLESGF